MDTNYAIGFTNVANDCDAQRAYEKEVWEAALRNEPYFTPQEHKLKSVYEKVNGLEACIVSMRKEIQALQQLVRDKS
jgi:hypothetical protein